MFNGEKVTLLEMLDAREQRAATQKELLETGPEYYLAVSLAPQELKQRMVKIEETHPYGRLVDLDVLWGNEELKSLHRGDLGLPPRRCFMCQEEAKVCGRNRRHSLEAMQEKITEIILTRKEQPSE